VQILCRALGGRTGRSSKGWDIGVSCIHPTAAAARLFAPLRLPVHMPVVEFHQDEVWELPPKAEVLARSDKTGVEMFRLGDSAMGVQGHPEYSKDVLMSIADRLLRNNLILVRTVTSPSSCAHLTHTAGFLGLTLGPRSRYVADLRIPPSYLFSRTARWTWRKRASTCGSRTRTCGGSCAVVSSREGFRRSSSSTKWRFCRKREREFFRRREGAG
jgi:hypothetical protein